VTGKGEPAGLNQYASEDILKEARKAQRQLEKLRRRGTINPWPSVRCDERTGPHCLVFGNLGLSSGYTSEVGRARNRLLALLAEAADSFPEDEWILGQRVRYLVEVSRASEAAAVARSCRIGRAWWCAGLAGYALHSMGRFEAADSAFREALACMPEEERLKWTDISVFLAGEAKSEYSRATPEQRDSLERRFWWLADPLFLSSVNDRRTEHFSRQVLAELLVQSESLLRGLDERSIRDLIVRHGQPMSRIRLNVPPHLLSGTKVKGIESLIVFSPHRTRAVPESRFLLDATGIRPLDWTITGEGPSASYDPPHLLSLVPIEHQIGVFERGDSAVIIAAFDQGSDWTWGNEKVTVGLFAVPNELASPAARKRRQREAKGLLTLVVGARPTVVSLELVSSVGRRAARARYGLRIHGPTTTSLGISNLLLLSPMESTPESLWQVLESVHGSLRVRPGERLGVYWELYGRRTREQKLSFSLDLRKVGEGDLDSLEDLDPRNQAPLDLHWKEVVPVTDEWPRYLSLDLSPDLSPGLYVLQLFVSTETGTSVRAARSLYVE
jgi:hypothetical protein